MDIHGEEREEVTNKFGEKPVVIDLDGPTYHIRTKAFRHSWFLSAERQTKPSGPPSSLYGPKRLTTPGDLPPPSWQASAPDGGVEPGVVAGVVLAEVMGVKRSIAYPMSRPARSCPWQNLRNMQIRHTLAERVPQLQSWG